MDKEILAELRAIRRLLEESVRKTREAPDPNSGLLGSIKGMDHQPKMGVKKCPTCS